MKIKDIIGALCMVILTISGIVLSFGLGIKCVLSSNGILSVIIKSEYLEKSEKAANEVLKNYMSAEKAEEILENISTKAAIRQITEAFNSNNVKQVANDVKLDMKEAVLNSIEDNSSQDVKNNFATVVSDAYIKSIFPVTEFELLSNIYSKLSSKLNMALVIISIVFIAIYIYLATGKKTYKWAIVALYNVIILNIILLLVIEMFNGIVIGNERTTNVIVGMVNKIKINIVISTIISFVIAVISNYIAYFKKRKHSK